MSEDFREDLSWAVCVFAVLISIITDALVTRILEGLYRVYWWARLAVERFLKACYGLKWWSRHLAHRSVARSQNYACHVLDWVKARTTRRHL